MDSVSQSPRWVKYYAENKELIAARRKARRALKEKKPVDEDAIKRYNDIMEEAAKLKPIVALKKLRETLARKDAAVAPCPPAAGQSPVNPPVSESPV
jgi:hypothetical protein